MSCMWHLHSTETIAIAVPHLKHTDRSWHVYCVNVDKDIEARQQLQEKCSMAMLGGELAPHAEHVAADRQEQGCKQAVQGPPKLHQLSLGFHASTARHRRHHDVAAEAPQRACLCCQQACIQQCGRLSEGSGDGHNPTNHGLVSSPVMCARLALQGCLLKRTAARCLSCEQTLRQQHAAPQGIHRCAKLMWSRACQGGLQGFASFLNGSSPECLVPWSSLQGISMRECTPTVRVLQLSRTSYPH